MCGPCHHLLGYPFCGHMSCRPCGGMGPGSGCGYVPVFWSGIHHHVRACGQRYVENENGPVCASADDKDWVIAWNKSCGLRSVNGDVQSMVRPTALDVCPSCVCASPSPSSPSCLSFPSSA